MNSKVAICLVALTFPLSAFGSVEETVLRPQTEQDRDETSRLRGVVGALDEQLSHPGKSIRLFAQVADKLKTEREGHLVPTNEVIQVRDPDSWPDLTVTSYVVLVRENETVAALQETPVSESGDWDNIYTHYYDEKGNTIAFQRYSSFFVGCPVAQATEISTYYYRANRLIAKDYSLTGQGGKAIQPDKCEFVYRHPYQIRKTWAGSKRATGIRRVW